MATGSAGTDGPLGGLCLSLFFGVFGSTVHHVQGWTLLFHWAVSNLRRYQWSVIMSLICTEKPTFFTDLNVVDAENRVSVKILSHPGRGSLGALPEGT